MATAEQYAEWIVQNQDKKGTPEFETVAQAYKMSRFEKTEANAPASRADQIPGVQPERQPAPDPSFLDRIKGTAEALGSLATGAVGGGLGMLGGTLGGLAGSLASGEFGTPQGARRAQDVAQEQGQRFTYAPRTEQGQQQLQAVSEPLSSLAGIPTAQMANLGSLAGPAARQAGQGLGAGLRSAQELGAGSPILARAREMQSPQAVPGFGSAMTPMETIRRERAANLPVPVKLTKGEATRDFEQQKFEKQAAKEAHGEPLRQQQSENNQNIFQSMDAWFDETGAQSPRLRAVGQVVTQSVVEKANAAKGRIRAAYDEAAKAGEMSDPIPVGPLIEYAEKHKAEAINAPIISSLEAKVKSIVGDGTTMSLNDLEEVRKMVGRLSGKDATNAVFGSEIKKTIDTLTEGAGGKLYQRARSLRADYAREFENVGVIDKLMRTKPGTTDRSVAYEDVFNHAILDGSLDDVKAVRKTLQNAGDNGQQAWRELQGQTIKYLQEETFKNAQRDIRGNAIPSFARIDRAINELDRGEKLDAIFGKQHAQKLRDLRDLVADIRTDPPGSVNHSNNIALLKQAFGELVSFKWPSATAHAISAARETYKTHKLGKQVAESLRQP